MTNRSLLVVLALSPPNGGYFHLHRATSRFLGKILSTLTGDSGPRLNVLLFIRKSLFPFIHFLDSGLFSRGRTQLKHSRSQEITRPFNLVFLSAITLVFYNVAETRMACVKFFLGSSMDERSCLKQDLSRFERFDG